MGYFIDAFKNFAVFDGRATRTQYWMFILIYLIIYIALVVIAEFTGLTIFAIIFAIATIIPSLSIGARRLHDTSRSGWWQLIGIIPLIGAIVLIVFFALDSHDENQYGANPKA